MFCANVRAQTCHVPAQSSRGRSRRLTVCAAEKGKAVDDSEARLAELESRARKGKGPVSQAFPLSRPESMDQVVWEEGQLLPEGWDKMDPLEKATQLYMGERGVLFWLNKAAFASVFIMAGLWIFFRFIGPAVGLYELSNGPSPM